MKTVLMLVDRPKSPTEKYAAGTVQILSDDLADHFIGTGAARFESYQQTDVDLLRDPSTGMLSGGVRSAKDEVQMVTAKTNLVTGGIELSGSGSSFRLRGNGAVILGDSRTDQNGNPTRTNKNAQGVLSWAQALSRKAGFYVTQNLGTSGDRTDQMLARLATAAADPAGIAVVWGGVNDIGQQYPSSTTSGATAFANIVTMVKALVSSGKHVVVVLDTPVTTWSAAQRGQLFDLNSRLLAAYSDARDVSVADFFSVVVDPASTTLQPRTGYYSDATHVGIKGAYYCGKWLQEIIDPLLPGALLPLPCGASDVYSLNPNALLDNGCYVTTTGGTAGTGASGTVPSGAAVSRASGTGTVAISAAASPDGIGNDLVMTHTANASDVFRSAHDVSSPATRVIPGATYVFEGEISVSGAAGLRAVKCYLEYNGSISGTIQRMAFEDSVGGAGPDEDFTIRFQTVPLTVPINGDTINWMTGQVRPSFNGSSSAVVKLRRLRIRRVI